MQRQSPVSGIFVQDPAFPDTSTPDDDVIEVHGLRTAPSGDVGGNEVVREEFCQQAAAAASAVGVVGRREVRLVLGDGQCCGRGRDGLVGRRGVVCCLRVDGLGGRVPEPVVGVRLRTCKMSFI